MTRSFERKSDAQSFADTERRKRQLMRAGLEAPKDAVLLIDYSKTFLSRRFGGAVRTPSAKQDEGRLRNYWLEKFGLRHLATITSAEIKAHLDHIQFELGHSPADRNRHRALMHTLFQEAMQDDKVAYNPVAKVPLILETAKRTSGTLEPLHQGPYLFEISKHGLQYRMLAELMLWTGARIMSAAALQWQDVDYGAGVIRIRRLIERATRTAQERTKGGGMDIVPLFPALRRSLQAHYTRSRYTAPSDFIAAQRDGSYIAYESYRDVHAAVLEALKIPRFTPHAIRKAFATNAKRAGYTRAEIREMLGHSTEAMTAKYDLEDIEHLVEKGKRLGFGQRLVSRNGLRQPLNRGLK